MKSIYKAKTKPFARFTSKYTRHISDEHKAKISAFHKELWRLIKEAEAAIENVCHSCAAAFLGKARFYYESAGKRKYFCSKNCLDSFYEMRDTEESKGEK